MSRAKLQAAQSAQQQYGQPSSSGGFASGFLLGQLTLALILFVFIKFFIFGEAPSADARATQRAAARRQRTLSHSTRARTLSSALRPQPSAAVLKPRAEGGLTVQKILEKTYYNVQGHQPESLDWFNVLIAQTIAQLRADAAEDQAVLGSLTQLLNGPSKPDFLDEIRVTEINLGEEFPIFSNCRVIPVDEHGTPIKELRGDRGERLQARMDVDLGDVLTLGIETKLMLNYPKPFTAGLPVALAVSVVRFSGTLSLSFSPSSQPSPQNEGHPLNPTGQSPTTLTFTFMDDYRLDLSVHSLIGSRARLQDVPKIAQLVEDKIHAWFDTRCVEPRFQQIVLPSLWPRKKNTRGGENRENSESVDNTSSANDQAVTDTPTMEPRSRKEGSVGETMAEQRTRDWAAKQGPPRPSNGTATPTPGKRQEGLSELELAGAEMREADEKERKRLQRQNSTLNRTDSDGLRMRSGNTVRGTGS
ncbi:Maintenance of mitochondrial morphology protein 1 [Cladosporium halotolerans]|uniref:Maintenance of mitochondrial morphology protein 1 n=1 Tax=Cladosporium halotolerans TaxID=1052096 RepID=A0AB34KFR2_9PEZI